MARTIGRALLYRHPYLVGRDGLVRGKHREVRTMSRELEQFLDSEGEWLLDKLFAAYSKDGSPADRNYYQGRLDQLAQVRRYLGQPQIMRERAQDD